MTDLLIRGLSDDEMNALRLLAAAAGKGREAYVRDLLKAVVADPSSASLTEHARFIQQIKALEDENRGSAGNK